MNYGWQISYFFAVLHIALFSEINPPSQFLLKCSDNFRADRPVLNKSLLFAARIVPAVYNQFVTSRQHTEHVSRIIYPSTISKSTSSVTQSTRGSNRRMKLMIFRICDDYFFFGRSSAGEGKFRAIRVRKRKRFEGLNSFRI
jgi:hypothetical protein